MVKYKAKVVWEKGYKPSLPRNGEMHIEGNFTTMDSIAASYMRALDNTHRRIARERQARERQEMRLARRTERQRLIEQRQGLRSMLSATRM